MTQMKLISIDKICGNQLESASPTFYLIFNLAKYKF